MAVDLGISLFVSAGILLFLAIVTTTLRCIARLYIVKAFWLDDWLMVIALAAFSTYCSFIFYGRNIDRGRPDDEIPLSDIIPALRAFYFAEISYLLSAFFIKMSIGTFLLRILKERSHVWMLYGVLAAVFIWSFVMFGISIFQCTPVSFYWNPEGSGTCLKGNVIVWTTSVHAVIIGLSDFFFAILPIVVIWNLQMNRKMKVSVSILMGFGALAGITSLARIPYIKALSTKINFFHNTAEIAVLSAVEPGVGIILGSGAAARPLFYAIFTKFRSHLSSNGGQRSKKTTLGSRGGVISQPSHFHKLSSFGQNEVHSLEDIITEGPGSNTVVIEAGKKFCRRCSRTEKDSRCQKCGEKAWVRHQINPRSTSEEQLTSTGGEDSDGGILRTVHLDRKVEFSR